MSNSRHSGFSLVELMVGLTIAAILLTVSAPAMRGFIQNNRLRAATLDLVNHINLARGEAVKGKVRVVLCRSPDPLAATPECGGTAQVWTTGWLVFASGDANATYEAGSDTLLAIGPPREGASLSVITNSTSNRNLEYNPSGTTKEGGATARFAICDSRGGKVGRQLNVLPHGRARIVKGSEAAQISCTSPT